LRERIDRYASLVWSPTQNSMRGLALWAVITNAVIMSTGEAVRLSQSGLGCPDWPKCTVQSLVASRTPGQTTLNTWIEFGNRLLNFPLFAVAVLAFIAAWRYRDAGRRRKDLLWLAGALPGGIIAQAVLGGLVVLTHLNPALVSAHFLLSASIVAAAVVLYIRCDEGDGPVRNLVRPDLRLMAALLTGVTAVMLAAGTVVTGTGPHAGNATAPRYHLPLEGVTQFHADIGWFLFALSVGTLIGVRFGNTPLRTVRLAWLTFGLLMVQGVIGYTQYFNHLPAGLVWVHATTAVLIWIVVLLLYLSTRERVSTSGTDVAEEASVTPEHAQTR
jgi:cytochrome c oxidase assembly protein subunit 15